MWITSQYSTTKVTVELRDVVNSVDIWKFEYPSFYEGEAKQAFEQKVIDHYYFRQIGQETVGRWLHMFRTRIKEIMPYYVQLYKTIKIMDELEDPFANVDMLETYEQESTGETSNQGSSTTSGENAANSYDKYSDTPQGSVKDLQNGSYLTNARQIENTGSNSEENSFTNAGDTSGTMKYSLHRKGNQGVNTYAHDMLEYRRTILNIDKMIIDELGDLFLGIY